MFLKRKTGSKEIVTCTNRLGHSLCYSELLELETNIAEKESSTKSQDYIPKKVEKENFVTYVYDNCDHNPETLSGVSMHCIRNNDPAPKEFRRKWNLLLH